jgi:MFS family permease
MNSERRNVALLAACQAMLFTNNSTLIAINGLAGLALAPVKSLTTLPVTCWVLGGAIATMPASLYMRRVGRQTGLTTGAGFGILGALVCAGGVALSSFWILCVGALLCGAYNAFGQYYRFAAADTASTDYKSQAISLVLAGGLVGGIIGPTVSRGTVDLLSPKYTGAYLSLIVFALITMLILRFIRIPNPTAAEQASSGRPLRQIMAQPKYIVAVLSGAVGFGVMNFLMTATPIAMGICGHPFGDAAFVISSHVIGMFAPSFFTGSLIKRFGTLNIIFVGVLLNFLSIAGALSGLSVAHFWFALVMLGVGWNFMFIGGTTLLTETYRPEERAKAQGSNDFLVYVMMTISSVLSGLAVTAAGWERVNLSALPMLGIVLVALGWLALRNRRVAAAPAG